MCVCAYGGNRRSHSLADDVDVDDDADLCIMMTQIKKSEPRVSKSESPIADV